MSTQIRVTQRQHPQQTSSIFHEIDFPEQDIKVDEQPGRITVISYVDDDGDVQTITVYASKVFTKSEGNAWTCLVEGFAEEFLSEDDGAYLSTEVLVS